MKTQHLLWLLLVTAITLTSCKKKGPVSDVEQYDTPGTYSLKIDADDITATISLIGAGGGGAGGSSYTGTSVSSGGGGGGGAGEVVSETDFVLEGGVTYTIIVGTGGTAGVVNQSGGNGQNSSILKGNTLVLEARAGEGGTNLGASSEQGGAGGTGYPVGVDGGDGNQEIGGAAAGGYGGNGGDNNSGFGQGGGGGNGAGIFNFGSGASATMGQAGGSGRVRIEWSGVK